MNTDNTITCVVPETLSDQINHIDGEMALLSKQLENLMASEAWISQGPHPEGSEYKGKGVWLYGGGQVHAIPRPQGFNYLAQTDRGFRIFKEFDHAFLWLNGVSWGQANIHGE